MPLSFAKGLLLILVLCPGFVLAQVSAASDPQALALASRASTAMAGRTVIEDMVLTGTASRIDGRVKEKGTATLKALASGEARMDLDFASGRGGEVYSFSADGPRGAWIGPDGRQHLISFHNALIDVGWFAPLLVLQRINASTHGVIVASAESIVQTGRSSDVLHATVPLPGPNASKHPAWMRSLLEHASQFDLYLDSATLLPTEMTFNGHPDNNARKDLPVQVRYSEYGLVNGILVPFRIRKYVNNGLIYDIRVESVAFNTGLNTSAFDVQAIQNLQDQEPKR
jgi:hypothetical protein